MKEEILRFLKNNKGDFYSGAKISEKLGVSRTMVWKIIKKLKDDGYKIESMSSKGYKLIESDNLLNNEELAIIIDKFKWLDKSFYFEKVDSTNEELKRQVKKYKGNLVAISKKQTKGKGRLGRVWESNDGLFMSYLLRPEILPSDAALFTQIGAAAIIRTFNKLTNINVKIKWPNDIVVNGRKICGILTELNAELNKVNFLVLGIGVNLNQEKFNKELKNIATSVLIETSKKIELKSFLEVFLKEFDILYNDFVNKGNIKKTLEICRNESAILNKKIRIINGKNSRMVKALDLNDKGQLIVLNEENKEEAIFYGEISIRGIGKEYI